MTFSYWVFGTALDASLKLHATTDTYSMKDREVGMCTRHSKRFGHTTKKCPTTVTCTTTHFIYRNLQTVTLKLNVTGRSLYHLLDLEELELEVELCLPLERSLSLERS